MRIILFGATGMVGQGVLRECVLDPDVTEILSVVRRASAPPPQGKLRELVTDKFHDFAAIAQELSGYDACFFCLGVSSFGMKEPEYRRVTYDITLAAAKALLSPQMTFVYVSGAGTDASGRSMWARVKGETENALLAMNFRAAYMFRPAGIVPLHGIRSKTPLYRLAYSIMTPILPMLLRHFPRYVTTTEAVGSAMLVVARLQCPRRIVEAADIAEVARSGHCA